MTELAQDLAKKLGLKGRKAYVSPQTESAGPDGESLGESSSPTADVGRARSACIRRWQLGLTFVSVPPSDVLQRAGISRRHGTRCDRASPLTATVASACVLITRPPPPFLFWRCRGPLPTSRPVQRSVHPRPPGHPHPRQRRASVLRGGSLQRAVGEQRPGRAPHALLGARVRTHGGVRQQHHQGSAGQPAGVHSKES